MSFVDDYTLSRSSVFKTLLTLFVLIAVVNIVFIRQLFINSEAFHREHLSKQLIDEIQEFKNAAAYNPTSIEQLLKTKQTNHSLFSYQLIPTSTPLSTPLYPATPLLNERNSINVGEKYRLEIELKEDLLEAYRQSVIPMVLTGIVLPIGVMLVVAFFFSVLILQKLERVNQAMNRFLCGERDVKIAVSKQDDEFDILAIHLNFMIEQMAKNEQTLKSLTVGLAHDMRTPMARLKLRLEELLSDSKLSDKQYQQFSSCHDELELILSLFNSMLEIAKLNSGQHTIENETVNLAAVAQDALEFIQPLAEQKNQHVSFRQDQPCFLSGDRSLLFRAVFNLIENAVKYTPEHGRIEVIADRFGVVVADKGIGLSNEEKLHVCKPMYRADKSRTEQGNGLGLSLVQAVVQRHHAQLLFRDNHPGLRARICLT
ncbi:ATP-binding protein [Vibrio sp. TRT 21S02]|uniref:HAMP domain-containing sensor histidine kinase n=1 Tax=Vibrio sp. TRT 21S02 TaxID=3418507 RepID=UPI003CFB00A9